MSTSDALAIASFVLSLLSLLVAGLAAYGTHRLTHFIFRLTTRHELQTHLLELNKELIRDPELWGVYDDHPMFQLGAKTPQHEAKLEAAVYFKLNLFHMVFHFEDEMKHQSPTDRAFFGGWEAYCSDFLNGSSLGQEVLGRKETDLLYDARFLTRARGLIKQVRRRNPA